MNFKTLYSLIKQFIFDLCEKLKKKYLHTNKIQLFYKTRNSQNIKINHKLEHFSDDANFIYQQIIPFLDKINNFEDIWIMGITFLNIQQNEAKISKSQTNNKVKKIINKVNQQFQDVQVRSLADFEIGQKINDFNKKIF